MGKMQPAAIITILALLEYAVFSLLVGLARARTGVSAPQITGHPEFERYFRVQQNTLERLIIFIPSLWIFAFYVNALVGAAIGSLFIVGRALYCIGYVAEPRKRGWGYNLGELANTTLMLGGLGVAVYQCF